MRVSTQLKIEAPVIVKSVLELAAVIFDESSKCKKGGSLALLVAFVQDTKALSSLPVIGSLVVPPEQFAVGTSAAYLLCAADILDSKTGGALLGKAGKLATTRNWATVLKLHLLANERDAQLRC